MNITTTDNARREELRKLYEAIETVCEHCVHPTDWEGSGKPCTHCFVRHTHDAYDDEYRRLKGLQCAKPQKKHYEWRWVSLDGFSGKVIAYVDPHERWNGWLCPLFMSEDVYAIEEMLEEMGDELFYDEDEDAYVCRSLEDIEYFHGVDVNGMHMYPIGTNWTWSFADEEE